MDALFILQASLGKRDLSASSKVIIVAKTGDALPAVLQGRFEEEEVGQSHLELVVSDLSAGALDLRLRYDPMQLKWIGFERSEAVTEPALVEVHSAQPGELRLARLGLIGADEVELGRVVFQRQLEDKAARVEVVEFSHFHLNGHQQPTDASTHFVAQPTSLPTAFTLYPNMPNPFNPETTIRYDLPEAQAVRLSLYNLSGQLIRTLVDAYRTSGRFSVIWDGRDDAGREVASGVYLYRLRTDQGQVETRKLVLLR